MRFVILGMHKSGTTLISKILARSGIDMGVKDSNIGYDFGEHFERLQTQELNKEILGCNHSGFSLDIYKPLMGIELNDRIVVKMKSAIEEANAKAKGDWGFKDPRTCLTWSAWGKLLNPCHIISIWRDPREVVRHYVAPRPWYKQSPSRIIRAYKTLRAWYFHNECICKTAEGNQEAILFHYTDFMLSDRCINELSLFINREIVDQRNPGLYRSKPCSPTLFRIAQFLCRLNGMNIPLLEERLKDLSV